MLREAAADIETALQSEDVGTIEHQTLSARLNDAVSEFESSHPTLYAVVNRMVDVLGQMGIEASDSTARARLSGLRTVILRIEGTTTSPDADRGSSASFRSCCSVRNSCSSSV